ncbi:MAG: NAD(P)H-hydrate dehydratase [Lachnospiraceae bacterium]|nr:NAD(P)H-hydrate dehydratase [Lachnospiraceae bacterium]
MYFLPNAQQMRACDRYTIGTVGIPGSVLMERAALAVAERVRFFLDVNFRERGKEKRILCICGTGNNGGDGAACARILREEGWNAEAAVIGDPGKFSDEMERQTGIAVRCCVPFVDTKDLKRAIENADVIVDALFGIGLARPVTGIYENVIKDINASSAYTIAVDIPSGVNADTGKICGVCVHADETVTMQFIKRGLVLYPGAAEAGEVTAAPVGIHKIGFSDAQAFVMESADLRNRIPARDPSGNKGTFGKVLIAAGSPGMNGAAYLAACAALRTGCGMVRIIAPEENREILQKMLPEAMLSVYRTIEQAEEAVHAFTSWADVIACGPGIGTSETGRALTEAVLSETGRTVVLDADALNCLSQNTESLDRHPRAVVTPHLGEMSRLSGKTISDLKEDPCREASLFAMQHGCICVMKDARTCIGLPDGRIFVNTTGSSGMATAGSGDVLTGILSGLCARGCSYEEAPALACLVHGLCGRRAEKKLGASYMIAQDIIRELSEVLRDL